MASRYADWLRERSPRGNSVIAGLSYRFHTGYGRPTDPWGNGDVGKLCVCTWHCCAENHVRKVLDCVHHAGSGSGRAKKNLIAGLLVGVMGACYIRPSSSGSR